MTKRMMGLFVFTLIGFFIMKPEIAKAEEGLGESHYVTIRKELTIMEGDSYSFPVETNVASGVEMYCNDEIPEGYEGFKEEWGVRGRFDENNRFIAKEVGKTTVWASITVSVNTEDEYRGSYSKLVTIRDYCVVTIIPKMDQELLIGNEWTINLSKYELYQNGTYKAKALSQNENEDEKPAVTIDEDGLVTAVRSGQAEVYKIVPDEKEGKREVLVATITVPKGGLDADKLIRAIGSEPKQLRLDNIGGNFVIWTSDDVSVAYVDVNGIVTPIGEGKTTVSANIQTFSGKVITISCPVTVTNPKLNKSELNLAKNLSYPFKLSGTSNESDIQWLTSDESVVGLWGGGTIITKAVGKSTIKVKVDGVTLKCVVRVTDPKLRQTELLLVKGKVKSIGLLGTNSHSKPKWSTSDKKMASVSKKGVVHSKNVGNVVITCEVDGVTFTCKASIGKQQAVKAVRAAESVVGSKYSQARRMQTGYYDCSSLIWRSYRQSGLYFGNLRYAPTAAEIARYLVRSKRTLPLKTIRKTSELLPGDLLFYAKKEKNGRYKNISHIAMYCGNGMMVHADGKKVSKVNYWVRSDTVLVARPVK